LFDSAEQRQVWSRVGVASPVRSGGGVRRAGARVRCRARKLPFMHGMLSAAIVIGVLGVLAAACLYVVIRVYLAGTRRGPAARPRQQRLRQHILSQHRPGQDSS
jgi:hypothetical protein